MVDPAHLHPRDATCESDQSRIGKSANGADGSDERDSGLMSASSA
jgi:hypothetical protein